VHFAQTWFAEIRGLDTTVFCLHLVALEPLSHNVIGCWPCACLFGLLLVSIQFSGVVFFDVEMGDFV